MMDDLITAVSAVGFPIVAYGAMFWYMVNMQRQHSAEISALKDALTGNTLALSELKDMIQYTFGDTKAHGTE